MYMLHLVAEVPCWNNFTQLAGDWASNEDKETQKWVKDLICWTPFWLESVGVAENRRWTERKSNMRDSRLGAAWLIRLWWWTGTDMQVYEVYEARSRLASEWAAGVCSWEWVGLTHSDNRGEQADTWWMLNRRKSQHCPHKPWWNAPLNRLCLFRYNFHGTAMLLFQSEIRNWCLSVTEHFQKPWSSHLKRNKCSWHWCTAGNTWY